MEREFFMSNKNISLSLTSQALKELGSALSECSLVLNEKKINAEQKEEVYRNKLTKAQEKIDMLTQCSQNAIANINELTIKLDKVLS